MIDVNLTKSEMEAAVRIGTNRQIEAKERGLADQHGFSGVDGWTVHIEGACGEQAAAKALGIYYSGSVNTFKVGGDVGELQVRTRSKHDYDLIVRHGDRDEDTFVLVTGRAPSFVVRGWILGRDAKNDHWLKTHGDRPAAWFVPASSLRSIDELKERLRGR